MTGIILAIFLIGSGAFLVFIARQIEPSGMRTMGFALAAMCFGLAVVDVVLWA